MSPGSHVSKDDYLRSFCSQCFSKIDIDIGNAWSFNFFFFKILNLAVAPSRGAEGTNFKISHSKLAILLES